MTHRRAKFEKAKSTSTPLNTSISSPEVAIIGQISLDEHLELEAGSKNAVDLSISDCDNLVQELHEIAEDVKQYSTNLPSSETSDIIRQIQLKIKEVKLFTSKFSTNAHMSYRGTFIDDIFEKSHTIKEPNLLFGIDIIRQLKRIHPELILSVNALYILEDIIIDIFTRISNRAREFTTSRYRKEIPLENAFQNNNKSHQNFIIIHEKKTSLFCLEYLIFDIKSNQNIEDCVWWKSERVLKKLIPGVLKKWKDLSSEDRINKFETWLNFVRTEREKPEPEFWPGGITWKHIELSTELLLSGQLGNHAKLNGNKHVNKFTSSPLESGKLAGLAFNVDLVGKMLVNTTGCVISSKTAVYFAAVINYLISEVLELAGDVAVKRKQNSIIARDIMIAIACDEELDLLFHHTVILESGVLCENMLDSDGKFDFAIKESDPFLEFRGTIKEQDCVLQELIVPLTSDEFTTIEDAHRITFTHEKEKINDFQDQKGWAISNRKEFENCYTCTNLDSCSKEPCDLEGYICTIKQEKEISEPNKKLNKGTGNDDKNPEDISLLPSKYFLSLDVIRALAARAGIIRLSPLAIEKLCKISDCFLETLIQNTCIFARDNGLHTIIPSFVENALLSSASCDQRILKLLGTGRNDLSFIDPHPYQVVDFTKESPIIERLPQLMKTKVQSTNAAYLVDGGEERNDAEARKAEVDKLLNDDLGAKKKFNEEFQQTEIKFESKNTELLKKIKPDNDKVQLILKKYIQALCMVRKMQLSVDRIIPFKPLMLLCKNKSSGDPDSIDTNWSPLAVNLVGYALENYFIRLLRGITKHHIVHDSDVTLVHQIHQGSNICRTFQEIESSSNSDLN